jgi:SAM-dependent methyltransferase
MMTQYDKIGSVFEESKKLPLPWFVEIPNVLRALGSVQGLRVLDLACGTGYYTRRIRELGAAEVVGVDISPVMIKHAVEIETQSPLGISYQVHDGAELPTLGSFDVVHAAYLLNYASGEEPLRKMVEGVRRNLKAGGFFMATTIHPDLSFEGPNSTRYGSSYRPVRSFDGGTEILVEAHINPPAVFTCYTLSREMHERVMREAGFSEFSWISYSVSDAAMNQFEPGFWDDWFANPVIIGLSARWPGSADTRS